MNVGLDDTDIKTLAGYLRLLIKIEANHAKDV